MSIQNSINQFLMLGALFATTEYKKSKEEAEKAVGKQKEAKEEAESTVTEQALQAAVDDVKETDVPGNIIGNKKAEKAAKSKEKELKSLTRTQKELDEYYRQDLENNPAYTPISARPRTKPRTVTPQQAMDKMREKGNTMVKQKKGYEKMREIFSNWKEYDK